MNTNSISVRWRWGGKHDKIRTIVIKALGPYYSKLDVGKEQKMIFTGVDEGPFYLYGNHCLSQKYGRDIGGRKIITKTKKEIKRELREKGYVIRGHYGKEELEDLAKQNNIALTYKTNIIEE